MYKTVALSILLVLLAGCMSLSDRALQDRRAGIVDACYTTLEYKQGAHLSHVWLRGVYNSTLIFLRPSYPPVIKVVDNKEIMEGEYYAIGVDGEIIAKRQANE